MSLGLTADAKLIWGYGWCPFYIRSTVSRLLTLPVTRTRCPRLEFAYFRSSPTVFSFPPTPFKSAGPWRFVAHAHTHFLAIETPSFSLNMPPTISMQPSLKPPGLLTSASRTLSASSLKERLSKLAVTPINPMAALHANVKCVTLKLLPFSASLSDEILVIVLALCPPRSRGGVVCRC